MDTAATGSKGRDFLRKRFESCYPFHPATLSVFQRKWRALTQFQQTRGALAMLAQWISWASREQFRQAAERAAYHTRVGAAARAGVPRRCTRDSWASPAST